MKQLQRGMAFLFTFMFLVPAVALAQTDSTRGVSIQVQSLLSQIDSLEQQLKMLIQTAAPSSTPPMWQGDPSQNGATSTPPKPPSNGNGMGNCSSFSRDLSMGSQGTDVAQLQQLLTSDGFLSASSTGIFGPLTAKALEMFQVHFGIAASSSASGFFGPLTRTFLQSNCGQGRTGSTTPPTWQQGSSTPPVNTGHSGWNMGTSTRPIPGPMGTSTGPRPCPQNENQTAASLFVFHVQLPPQFMDPCTASSSTQQ